jgi:hypothetical protein
MHNSFIKPQYAARCFADLPATVQAFLGGEGASPLAPDILAGVPPRHGTVIFFFVDAFGWRFFEQFSSRSPFLDHFVRHGRVARLTSQFPSTTAGHVTCVHTGLPVGQSGVYEWQYYEPQVDALITPLLFSFAGTQQRDTLKPKKVDPAKLYPTHSLYQALQQSGVTAYVFQHREYTPSTFSDVVFRGADVIPYKTLPEGLVNLCEAFARRQPPAYFFFYYDRIDAIGHEYGPASPQIAAEIDAFLICLERLFLKPLRGRLKNTLVLLTADHGLVEVDPKTTIYLNLDSRFAGIQQYLKTNRKRELLVPAGSCRDLFLYVKEGLLNEARQFLAEHLAGQAEVHLTQSLLDQGYFGPWPVSPAFLARVGNLVILPYARESVWWYERGKFEQKYYGHHGGLTRPEMEIPLLLYSET